jgi:hypothetical protein
MTDKTTPHEPTIRATPGGKGVLIDDLDAYATAIIGLPPDHFNETLRGAHKLLQAAGALVYDAPELEQMTDEKNEQLRDTLLVAALAASYDLLGKRGENPLAFVQRAKQVVAWCKRPLAAATPLEELKNKAQEIARQVAKRLFPNEGFVLLVFNTEAPGHVTWTTSATRAEAIEELEKSLADIKSDLRARRATSS